MILVVSVHQKCCGSNAHFEPVNILLNHDGSHWYPVVDSCNHQFLVFPIPQTIPSQSTVNWILMISPPRYRVNWILKDGTTKTTYEKAGIHFSVFSLPHIGLHLLEIAHKNGIDLEGACEASLACSTCHVIVEDPKVFDHLPEAGDEENDMLDLAFGLTDTYESFG